MKPTPRDTYIAKAADIQNKIAQLQRLADEHFGHTPDDIHWGHVGNLERVQELLNEILNTVAKYPVTGARHEKSHHSDPADHSGPCS